MTDTVGESLSALQDNQAGELDVRRILKEMRGDESVRARWARHQRVSSLVRQEDANFLHLDISQRVREQLTAEPALKETSWSRLLKPVASLAVAATVTMGILTGTQLYQQSLAIDGTTQAAGEVAVAAPFDNALTPVAAGHFPGLSLRASSTSSDNNRRSSRNAYSAEALLSDYGYEALESARTDSDMLAEERLNQYLRSHAESASFNNSNGLLPYARVGQAQEH